MQMPAALPLSALENTTEFLPRHIGIDAADEAHMLSVIGEASRRALIDSIVPRSIARSRAMDVPPPASEAAALAELKAIASRNQVLKSFIGQGYYGTHTPGVILRNILENPAWYTAYTPYQAEISQGRMEALVNFQTMVCDLTGMPIANASMLDEATAAAEAMTLAKRSVKSKSHRFIVAGDAHPQTIEVIQTRAAPMGIEVVLANSLEEWNAALEGEYFAVLAQYPATSGRIDNLRADVEKAHGKQAAFIAAADLLALTLITPPGEWGADIVVGTTQRFGMPMGAGGPHAAYMACRDDFKRSMPGRLVGVSVDVHGKPAYRLALQTREQHIRREKATSNICTAQVLPAVIASMYAVYHGPQGLRRIAQRVASYTAILTKGLEQLGAPVRAQATFDTVSLKTDGATKTIAARAVQMGVNLRIYFENYLCISLDETTTREDIALLWKIFAKDGQALPSFDAFEQGVESLIPSALRRTSPYLTHPVFNTHHSETAMLRYIRQLSDKDLALDRCMIPLGSCTMKLNATSEMIPITWPEFANVHPFAPAHQLEGYRLLDEQLSAWLCQATGYAGVSLQPNAGSQGEYAGLLAIKAWHAAQGHNDRNICLIPSSAHGTNPASAQMVGMQVVVTKCDDNGNVDMADLQAKCEQYSAQLACMMITYPSTHGVFETQVKELCELVHQHGGRVYVDGANMNALVGVAAPGEFGGDVSHLNLHKTFCIPHGGGGPGVGPVCVVQDLVPYLPGHATAGLAGGVGAVSAAPLGNAAVLPISWMYIRMMGAEGLQAATEAAILSANYISARLKDHYPTLYASENGHVAHECILDLRQLKDTSGVMAEDVAKRLIDYGFHAPTLSFPVPNTLMVEPTESENLFEIDRFIDAMIAIRNEIRQIESGAWPQDNNPLKNAPHTAESLLGAEWNRPYARETAAYPVAALRSNKYWSPVGRVDNVWGDRNLSCSCIPVSDYA
ncbi:MULTISPECIES: aminomethyl-transferring glycine dehydrogenase [unclassified Simplicispira]|uniref:aminomethyl-transferring glycine dehydrogenase n=1 Tax=unclassified Simplicispira TaxID=2630407 RepID=UPI000D5CA675|nr:MULTISPECIES: aminomethyl-transferring glycine dehydrogenase [unclassified Simplicispira]PVY55560.1 glycine dehydrogenase (decarboxylating) [Simplicispira sp. 125]REG16503.1 glycine dehydrogenase [Simplicispira sp. 110]